MFLNEGVLGSLEGSRGLGCGIQGSGGRESFGAKTEAQGLEVWGARVEV